MMWMKDSLWNSSSFVATLVVWVVACGFWSLFRWIERWEELMAVGRYAIIVPRGSKVVLVVVMVRGTICDVCCHIEKTGGVSFFLVNECGLCCRTPAR